MRPDLAEKIDQFRDAAYAFHACIRDGNHARLQALLNLNNQSSLQNLDRAHPDYGPPLNFAAWCGDLEAVELLLAAGADPLCVTKSTKDPRPRRALQLAAMNGHREVFNRLSASESLKDQMKGMPDSPLCIAARHGHARIVEDLLTWTWSEEQKADALLKASMYWHFDTVAVLLEGTTFSEGDINWALIHTVDRLAWGGAAEPPAPDGFDYYNLPRLVELLVDALNPSTSERQDCYSRIVCEAAHSANFTGVLTTFLEKGADPDGDDQLDFSALHVLAAPVPVGDSGRQVMNEPAIEMLLRYGASVTRLSKDGNAPLQLAALGADLRCFRLYISKSYESKNRLLALTNANQETLLHYAAAGCRVEIMQYLISQGLDVNAKNSNGWTPLMCALTPTSNRPSMFFRKGMINTVAESTQAALLLLSRGADPLITTDEGWTPLHALALHYDLDLRGQIADLATKLIAQGVDPEARAPLLTPRVLERSPRFGMPWGHRLPEKMMESIPHSFILQPSLTPLHWSAQRGAVGVVRALVAAGVNTTTTDANGMSAIGMACDSKVLNPRTEAASAIIDILTSAGMGPEVPRMQDFLGPTWHLG